MPTPAPVSAFEALKQLGIQSKSPIKPIKRPTSMKKSMKRKGAGVGVVEQAQKPKKSKKSGKKFVNGLQSKPKPISLKMNGKDKIRHQNRKTTKLEQVSPKFSKVKLSNFDELLLENCTGDEMLEALLAPLTCVQFFRNYWEEEPLHISRKNKQFYGHFFTPKSLSQILIEKDLQYGVNLDVTKYENGSRVTLNPPGKAVPASVWNFFKDGCSVRLLNPQTYSDNVWNICSKLQDKFSTFVGANVYFTPKGTQGFAPHWDDIDAFIMQLEGNFRQEELTVTPVLTVWLEPGDLLYIPRGQIHQGKADPNSDSLHITISACHKNSYAELLSKMVEPALQKTIAENCEIRRSLPVDYFNNSGCLSDLREDAGIKQADVISSKVDAFSKILASNLSEFVGAAVDQMAKEYQNCALPPYFHKNAKEKSIDDFNTVRDTIPNIGLNNSVRLLTKNCLRLVQEEEDGCDKWRVYFSVQNSRVYKERMPNFIELSELGENLEEAVILVISSLDESFPSFTSLPTISKFVQKTADVSKIDLVSACNLLFQQGLILIQD